MPEDPACLYGWVAELAALTSPGVKAKVVEGGISLSCYGALG